MVRAPIGRRTAFFPHATEAVWELVEHRYPFIGQDREAPGGATIEYVRELGLEAAARVAERDAAAAEPGIAGVAAARAIAWVVL